MDDEYSEYFDDVIKTKKSPWADAPSQYAVSLVNEILEEEGNYNSVICES